MPKTKASRPGRPLLMLKALLQSRYGLNDPGLEKQLARGFLLYVQRSQKCIFWVQ
jgi:hypothetical protein